MENDIIEETTTNPIVALIKSKLLLIVAICVGVFVFFSVFVFDPFNLHLSFRSSDRFITKTDNVVTQIKKISEFTTACYFEEIVLDTNKYKIFDRKVYEQGTNTWSKIKSAAGIADAPKYTIKRDSTVDGRIVFIVKSKVRAGYDLSKIQDGDLEVSGDTLSVKLPAVEIFDIIANPSDFELYHQEGTWNDGDVKKVQAGAKQRIKKDAINYGLLEKAESSGKESLISLFKTFGFSEVVIK